MQEQTEQVEKAEMRWLSEKGDTKIIFDPENDEEADAAEKQFDSLIKKGFTAYKVKKDGSQGKKISKFDRSAGRMILVPKLVGG